MNMIKYAALLAIVALATGQAHAATDPNPVPDAGSAYALAGLAAGGIALMRRFLR